MSAVAGASDGGCGCDFAWGSGCGCGGIAAGTDFGVLYMVSMPSGMMTIKLVPTRTPMPMVDMRRSCDCDKLTASGNIPAAKDLYRAG